VDSGLVSIQETGQPPHPGQADRVDLLRNHGLFAAILAPPSAMPDTGCAGQPRGDGIRPAPAPATASYKPSTNMTITDYGWSTQRAAAMSPYSIAVAADAAVDKAMSVSMATAIVMASRVGLRPATREWSLSRGLGVEDPRGSEG
jgi:hypothetical protein